MENEYHIEGIDKIALSTTAKGLIQAEIRLHRKVETKEDIDKLIELQEYAFNELRKKFKNMVWSENGNP